jgi:hypothetical protein
MIEAENRKYLPLDSISHLQLKLPFHKASSCTLKKCDQKHDSGKWVVEKQLPKYMDK